MPKKVFAVTNVKIGSGEGEYFPTGSEVDHHKFTKEQLVQLHEEGAVEIRVVDEEPAEDKNASNENPDGNTEPDGGKNPEGSNENE